jgi:hypothetical protein
MACSIASTSLNGQLSNSNLLFIATCLLFQLFHRFSGRLNDPDRQKKTELNGAMNGTLFRQLKADR